MKKCALVLALLLGLGLTAPQAQANAIEVTYNLTGTLTIPGLFPIGVSGGTVTLKYNATGVTGLLSATAGGNVIPGTVNNRGGTLNAAISIPSIPSLVPGITGAMGGNIMVGGGGNLLPGGTLALGSLNGVMVGALHCFATPTHCGVNGFTTSVPKPTTMWFNLGFSVIGATPSGLLLPTFTALNLPIAMLGSLPITGSLTFTEVGRHVIPEPTSFSLAGLGLLGLAAAGWRVRRSRRS